MPITNYTVTLTREEEKQKKKKKKKGLRACTCLHWMELEQYYSKTAEAKEPYAYQQEVNYPLSA